MTDITPMVTVAQAKWQHMIPVSMEAAPPIPPGCICSYTWHSAGDGRVVRNSPLKSCPADHTAIDEASRSG
jgi:hypothetical protein